MSLLRITLFGGFDIRQDGGPPVEIAAKKAKALVAFLACRPGQPVPREQVRVLLWGRRDEAQAQGSLRHLLTTLRQDLGNSADRVLETDREVVALRAAAVDVDVRRFEDLVRLATPEALERAVDLYRGPLLDGVELAEPGFQDWVLTQRRRLHEAACRACRSLLINGEPSEAAPRAIEFAQRLLTLDGCDEEGHRALMRLYAGEGNIGLALRQYQTCGAALLREIGAQASAETEQLALEIRNNRGVGGRRLTIGNGHAAKADADGPTLAVLPFAAGEDADHQVLARGMTEDVITELSRFRQLFVRAKPSVSTSDAGADPQRAGIALGVKYVVDGSVRRLGDRIRITTQLVDVASNNQLWAERFDGGSSEIFEIQDQIIATIVGTLVGRLAAAGVAQATRKHPSDLAAYECVLRGYALMDGDRATDKAARDLFEAALALDPGYARAHAGLAYVLVQQWFADTGESYDALDHALSVAKQAVVLDDSDTSAQHMLGWVHLNRKEFELAAHHNQRAQALSPNDPDQSACRGALFTFLGETDEAMRWYERARRLDPYYEPVWYWRTQGIAHLLAGRYDQAISNFLRSPNRPVWLRAYLAAAHALLGRTDEAHQARDETIAAEPRFSARRLMAKEPFRRQVDRDLIAEGLRRAGFSG
jgi:DNA-binding SARP family transcriptional activator/TolB-like protein/Flp pilus assembly protein TadD